MKAIYRAFMKQGIPFMDMAGIAPGVAGPMKARRILLLFLYAILLAATAALLVFWLMGVMNMIPAYCDLPGVSRNLDDHDLLILITPVVTALFIAWLLRYAGDKTKGVLRPFQGLLMIGAGVPLGLEGPLSDLPFSIAEGEDWPVRQRRILSAAFMTGGVAFLFSAPLMAIALAIELMMIEMTWLGITVVILGGGTGVLLHRLLIGTDALFDMPDVPSADLPLLLGYTATGIIVALLALLAKRMINGMRWLFAQLPGSKVWWPVIAAVVTGVAGYFNPDLTGAGYSHIDSMLLGQITLQFLVVMVLGKLILMSIAVGGGVPGGTMAPLVISGGAAGLFITFLLQFAFPALHLNFAVAALVGMAAMFAAGNRVLPAAIFFAIETTQAVHALLPVICACTAAYTVVFLLARKKVLQPAVQ